MRKMLAPALAFLFAETSVRACGTCADMMIAVGLPCAGPVFMIFLAWLICAALARGLGWPVEMEAYGLFPTRRGLIRVASVSFGVYALLWFLTECSFLIPALLISSVWVFSFSIRTLKFGFQALPPDLARFRKFKGIFVGVQILFLLASVASIPLSAAYAHSIPVLVDRLSWDPTDVRAKVIRELITKGEPAVKPLIATCRQGLANSHDLYTSANLSAALYCLGQIGGKKASKYLAAELKARVNFLKEEEVPWQRAICFAYAQSAGPGAVADLRDLYRRCTDENAAAQRWAILVALLKTGSKPGVTFVLDNMRTLMDEQDRTSRAAFAALLALDDPRALRNLPVSTAIGARAFVDQPEMKEYLATFDQIVGGMSIDSIWMKKAKDVRRNWLGDEHMERAQ